MARRPLGPGAALLFSGSRSSGSESSYEVSVASACRGRPMLRLAGAACIADARCVGGFAKHPSAAVALRIDRAFDQRELLIPQSLLPQTNSRPPLSGARLGH